MKITPEIQDQVIKTKNWIQYLSDEDLVRYFLGANSPMANNFANKKFLNHVIVLQRLVREANPNINI